MCYGHYEDEAKSRNEIKVHRFWSIYSLKIYLHTHGQYARTEAPGHILHSPPFSLFSLGSLTQPSPVMIRQCPVELPTNLREVSQCPEKAPTRAFSLLIAPSIYECQYSVFHLVKAPTTNAFTFKNFLRHYATETFK